MKTLLAHPTGNQNFRQLGAVLHAHGLLGLTASCLSWNLDGTLGRLLPTGVRGRLSRRSFGPWAAGMATRPWLEPARLAAQKLGWRGATAHERGWCCVDAVYRDFDQWLARKLPAWQREHGLDAVYAYEDGALAQFRRAKDLGLRCFYDQPIGHWKAARRLLGEEAERLPEWAATLTGNLDSTAKLERKDAELAAADVVFAACQFTAETLAASGMPTTTPVVVTPYGAPPPITEEEWAARWTGRAAGGPLRAIFVGGLSQRKGLAEVFAAVRQLRPHVELTVIGLPPPGVSCAALQRGLRDCRYLPSLSHAEVLREMRAHDVLLFPSLFEGFGLVILEAMSQGVPVITTRHTGGPEVIRHGEDGFLVPIRDADAIAGLLAGLVRDRARLRDLSRAAWHRSGEFTWESYGAKVAAGVRAGAEPGRPMANEGLSPI